MVYFFFIFFMFGRLGFVFFFSSRRRHTRWPRDWSSDVCSSDLGDREHELLGRRHFHIAPLAELDGAARLFVVGRAFLRLPVDAAADRTRTLEIRRAFVGARLHVP